MAKIKLKIKRDKSNVQILNLKCNYIKALQGLTSGEAAFPPVCTGGYSHSVIFMTALLSPNQGFGS